MLTGDEYEQMKLHPAIGEEILRPLEPLKEMLPAIRWHHEAWNGRGYPDGLKGEGIPLTARVVAVADAFDAMTSDRPYRLAMPAEDAVEEVERCAGSQFDPDVAVAFLAAWESGAFGVTAALRAAAAG